MSRLAPCSTIYRNQSNTLPPIQSRDTPSYQGIALPPIQLRDESLAGQPGVESQQPNSQQLQPSLSIEPRSPLSTEKGRRTSALTWKSGWHSILNPTEPVLRLQISPDTAFDSPLLAVDPVLPSTSTVYTFPNQKQLSNTSPRADGNTVLPAQDACTILTPGSPLQADAQRVAIFEDAGSLPLSPASGREYRANPKPLTSSLKPIPTPTTQFNKQQYESTSSSRNLTDALRVSEGTNQAPTSLASTLYGKEGRRPQASHLNSSELSMVTTVQSEDVMQSQGLPGGPYVTAVTKAQDSTSLSGSVVSSKQTLASNSIQVMTFTTSEGSYDLEVDVLAASREADEKRSRNAGASARFRQRRKEKESEANKKIKELEQERDFYRSDRDRLRDVVFNTPGLEYHARWSPSSPQAMPSASFPELMPQMTDSQALPQAVLQATHPTSQRASKRRRTDTGGGYTGTNHSPPTTIVSPVQVSFSPQSTLPSAKYASETLLPRTTWSQKFDPHVIGRIYRQGWPRDEGRGQQIRYSTLSGCVGGSNHLPTSTLYNFPFSDLPSHASNAINSAII